MKETYYTFFWRDGKRDVFPGNSASDALNDAGYGQGALRALDFWAHGDNKEWEWDAKEREWKRVIPLTQ